jgi:hypothetical protein
LCGQKDYGELEPTRAGSRLLGRVRTIRRGESRRPNSWTRKNRLNHAGWLAPPCESITGEECIDTERPLTPSHGAVGPAYGSAPRRLLRWMVRHPGAQAVGVTLATVLCFAVLPPMMAPGHVVARSENSHGEFPHWEAPARGHESTPTGPPTVLPARGASSPRVLA